ncbi:alpha-L-fucosidase [Porticoccus sp. GXU_MW_L64]
MPDQQPNAVVTAIAKESASDRAKADLEQRMAWFNDARFGMFIHWGTYSNLGGEWQGKPVDGYAEWIQARADIPGHQYAPLAEQFNPVHFDPEKWVVAAKNAGMKYLVITTKHHEGFGLWPSAVSDYDVGGASPFDRDILAELSRAAKKHGIKFGAYYSIIDWHHPSQEPNAAGENVWRKWGHTLMKEGQKPHYVAYMKAQIKELIDNYDADILWFDGDWAGWWTTEDGDDLYHFIRDLKPSIIINNRVSKRTEFKFDFGTPENETPGEQLDHFWEACWTINNTWGYSKFDDGWKSDRVLIQKLVDIASKGGNLLLNVGPTGDGVIQEQAYQRLSAIGSWMQSNGESIYGTQAAAISAPENTRLTAKDGKLYVHLFSPFQQDRVVLPLVLSLQATNASASVLANGQKVPVSASETSLTLDLSGIRFDKYVTTLVIE